MNAAAVFQGSERRRDAIAEVRVAYVEAYSYSWKCPVARISRMFAGCVTSFCRFSISSLTPSGLAKARRCSRAVMENSRARGLQSVFALSQVDDEEAEGNLLGHFEGALDLIHGVDAVGLFRMDDVDAGRAATAHFVIGKEGRMHGKGLRRDWREPVGDLADVGAVGVVEVLARGKNFDALRASLLKCVEQAGWRRWRRKMCDEMTFSMN